MQHYLPYIYTIGATQGVILALALWRKKINTHSNRVLSVWLLILAFDMVIKSIYLNDNNTPLLMVYRVVQYFPFLYASFFYVYVQNLINKQAFGLRNIVHFSAFIIYLGINLPAILMTNPQWLIGLRYFDVMLYLYSVAYVVAGLLTILRYRITLQQQRVDTQDIELQWLTMMGYSQMVIWLIAISQWLVPIDGFNHWNIYVAVALWMIMIGYLSLTQQNIPNIEPIKKIVDHEYDQRFVEVEKKLHQLINEQNIHVQPNLTIAVLAKASGYPEYLISLFINRQHGMNFYDFINQLRINEAQKMLKQFGDRTILQIAYECGYNSKSTFNTAFKKFTKHTPSQFRQMHGS